MSYVLTPAPAKRVGDAASRGRRDAIRRGIARRIWLFALDAGALSCAGLLFAPKRAEGIVWAAAFAAYWIVAFVVLGRERCSAQRSARDEFYFALAAVALGFGPYVLLFAAIPALRGGGAAVLLAPIAAIATVGAARAIDRALRGSFGTPGSRAPLRPVSRVALSARCFDLIVAAAALVVFAPAVLVAVVAVWVETGRPVVYRQRRVGLNGTPFWMYKIRTMHCNAEERSGVSYACIGDARVTLVGRWIRRFSIDEVLQLINVARGEMSIVGPRPERPEYVRRFRKTVPRYHERHRVRPGITGWAQVNMPRILRPSQTPEKLAYDLFYAANRSVYLDTAIVVKTACEFAFHRTV